MLCVRCGSKIDKNFYNSKKYCSLNCSKLFLKSEWRKRTRQARNAYAREYRRARNGGNRSPTYPSKLREEQCLKCGGTLDLQVAHIKPLWAGGTHKYVITLCRTDHHQFDEALREFWKMDIIKL